MQTIAMLECTDDSSACGGWAAGGECSKNPGFMHATCRKACGRCELQADDARHALEVVTYAVRNHHAGCAHAQQGGARLPECEGSAERLAATLAIAHEGATGRALQRVVEALAREVSASSPPPSRPLPWSPAAEATAVASVGVGGSAVGPFVQLSDGGRMPSVGVGTWLTTGSACYELVRAALRAGLRHIDTSENYANHGEIGRALAETSVPRGELFIADKLSLPHSYSAGGARKAVGESLRLLGVSYLDLYMLHSVGPSVSARHEAWREMVAMQQEGLIRHIGVSNFGTAELRELKASFPDAPPATLQSKFSPYHRGRTGNGGGEDFHAATAELGVALTAYCPLNDWPSKLKAVVEQHARRHWSLPRTFSEPSRRQWRMRTSARLPHGPARRRRRSSSAGASSSA